MAKKQLLFLSDYYAYFILDAKRKGVVLVVARDRELIFKILGN
jgi:hypothetical protein